jgi:predicted transposase YdaD
MELIETLVVCTFPRRLWEQIVAMLELSDLKETCVYSETREETLREGCEEEARSLIMR